MLTAGETLSFHIHNPWQPQTTNCSTTSQGEFFSSPYSPNRDGALRWLGSIKSSLATLADVCRTAKCRYQLPSVPNTLRGAGGHRERDISNTTSEVFLYVSTRQVFFSLKHIIFLRSCLLLQKDNFSPKILRKKANCWSLTG